jgi:hypothetical protein
LTAQGFGFRRGLEKLVQRTAFIGLNVAKANITPILQRHYGLDGLAHDLVHSSQSGMDQQRRLVYQQVLIA